MTKVNQFNQKLHTIFQSDLFEMHDLRIIFFALMLEYGVKYKEPIHLSHDLIDKCDEQFKGDVEEMFLDEINTEGHSKRFELFNDACHQFLDYSHSSLINNRTSLADLGSQFEKLKQAI